MKRAKDSMVNDNAIAAARYIAHFGLDRSQAISMVTETTQTSAGNRTKEAPIPKNENQHQIMALAQELEVEMECLSQNQ